MTATSALAYSATSVPTSLRTSGHATPNHGSRSNTPVRIKRVLQAQVDIAPSAPVAVDLEAGYEGRNVRRSSSAHALDSTAVHRNISSGRRRRLSVTTFGDPEGLTCVDAPPTILGDVLSRRQLADAALQESTAADLSGSLPVLSFEMKFSDYVVLGPDACVALACGHLADPTAKYVVVFAMSDTTHILTRQDLERIERYSHNPQTDTLGAFLAGTPSVPALYSTASLSGAAGLLLEHPYADFVAIVEDAGNGGGGGGGGSKLVGLLSRKDIARALLGDRRCVCEAHPAADSESVSKTAITAAAAAVPIPAASETQTAADAAGVMNPSPSALAASGSSPGTSPLASGLPGVAAISLTPSEARDDVSGAATDAAGTLSPHINSHNNYFNHHNHHNHPISVHMAPQGAQILLPSPRVWVAAGAPPPPPPPQQQVPAQLQHHSAATVRQTAVTAAAATATAAATTMAAASPAAATAAAGQLQHQQLSDITQHQLLAGHISTDGTVAVSASEVQLLPTPAHLFEPSGSLGGAQFSSSPAHPNPNNGMEHSPAVPEGLKSFADPIKSGWDVLDNMDDALDVLGMLGKTMNADAMGRKLLGDVMGTMANIVGSSSGTGWMFKYLYDGDCSICRTFQAMLEKLDNGGGRVIFVDISSQAFNPLEHGGINYKAAMETIHILSANGQIFKGVTAVIKLLAAVDPEIASKMGVVTAALPLLSLAYMLVSKNRHHLSKAWARVLRVTKADRALFGRDILASIPDDTQLQRREWDLDRGMEMGMGGVREVGFVSPPPAGLAGSGLGPSCAKSGPLGGGGGGAGEESSGHVRRHPLRSHELQTQPSM